MFWTNYEQGRLAGFSPTIPNRGDLFHQEMRSGKTGVFRFDNVERQSDPSDMFFADMAWVGYLEDTTND